MRKPKLLSTTNLALATLAAFLSLVSGCTATPTTPYAGETAFTRNISGPSRINTPPRPVRNDPALAMQKRISYFPSPWPELSFLDQGSDNYKKLTGTLARMQLLAARKPEAQEQLPIVLINANNDCLKAATIGLYKPSCDTIKVDYTDGELTYEYPIEVEAVIAHEWGHHLAAKSNLNVSSTEHEIAADCFAGVVFGYYVKHQLVSVEEAAKALEMMAQLSNNSESGIHPNMQSRTSAFMGGLARIAEPQGETAKVYDSYCGSLEQVLNTSAIQSMGLSW